MVLRQGSYTGLIQIGYQNRKGKAEAFPFLYPDLYLWYAIPRLYSPQVMFDLSHEEAVRFGTDSG